MRTKLKDAVLLLLLLLSLAGCGSLSVSQPLTEADFSLSELPEYSGEAYVELNGNVPYFTDEDLTTEAFELYSPLDELGRCGTAYANICPELMPTEDRGEIGMVKPSGWHHEIPPARLRQRRADGPRKPAGLLRQPGRSAC